MKNDPNIEPKFSFFKKPINQIKPYKTISLNDVYQVLTGNYLKSVTSQLRKISDKKENQEFKGTKFPYVTFSGIFKQRNKNDLIQHSGLMVIDIDKISDVEIVKLRLLNDKFFEPQLLFISPNGNGLKLVISIDISGNYSHGDHFDAIRNYINETYQINVDDSGRDVSRACFICHDPDAFLNPRHGKMNKLFPPEIYLIDRKKFDPGKWLEKSESNRTFKPVPLSTSLTRIQYKVEVIIRRIENCQLDLTLNYDDWCNIGFAFSDEFSEAGREYFHRVSRFHQDYNPIEADDQYNKCMKEHKTGKRIRIGTFFYLAENAGINIRI